MSSASEPHGELPMARKVLAFAVMCVGFFIALLAIRRAG